MTSVVTDKVTETMAEFYCSTSFEDLPPDVVRATKRSIEDTLGCVVGGFSMPSSQIINQVMTTQGGVPEATVLVSGVGLPAALASYINCHMANALDGDDVFIPSSHLAAGIVPPALAVAQREKRSGSDLIAAVGLDNDKIIPRRRQRRDRGQAAGIRLASGQRARVRHRAKKNTAGIELPGGG